MKRILVAINQELAAGELRYAVELAQQFGAALAVVQVTKFAVGDIDSGVMPEADEKERQRLAKNHLETIRTEFSELTIEEFDPIGNPVKEIRKVIENWNADLLVIGHQTHSLWHGLFKQNIEKELVEHLTIPLLIIPEK